MSSFTAAQRDDAMRLNVNSLEAEIHGLQLHFERPDDAAEDWTPPESIQLSAATLSLLAERAAAIRQNFHANPPLLPADSWRSAGVRCERMPTMSDCYDAVMQVEFPAGRIFRKSMRVSGEHGPMATETHKRAAEVLRDVIYWLAGECGPITPPVEPQDATGGTH